MQLENLRAELRDAKHLDEELAVTRLLAASPYDEATSRRVERRAQQLVRGARAQSDAPLLDTFMAEYGLENAEGVALMCLAESLLRVPDATTADFLIADKLGTSHWADHLGQADSLLVNASTWALMLTGQLVDLDDELTRSPATWLRSLVAKLSEPVVLAAVRAAMEILGREFVLGQTIERALDRCSTEQLYSFDMLGEAARDQLTAQRYFENYRHAIEAVGNSAQPSPSISVKLSALHPRYEASQRDRVMHELVPRVSELVTLAAALNVTVTIDAEEADRLELSLDVLHSLVVERGFKNVGFVVQAYSKRALSLLEWLAKLAEDLDLELPIRLVKGAYWDAEIKHAQVQAYADFPVYTQKANTDLSYLVCARKIFQHRTHFYGQFATHNAHTVAAIMEMGRDQRFEFQRLHGMGEILYREARAQFENLPPVPTYAPVGAHHDLLAYLVRRLLENGANSSFVNRFLDRDVEPETLVADPVRVVAAHDLHAHDAIRKPAALFPDRANSQGLDLSDPQPRPRLKPTFVDYVPS